MSVAEFKAAANEVGNWLWGTVRGGFNEKQSIGQIVTDAVISMFPIAGEVTAARDCIAAGIRLAQEPQKREEVIEWVAFVLPLLAIIPLLGGALKGIGKLLMLAGKSVDQDRKILEAMVWLLNKVGHGDAYRFIRELDFTRYAGPVTKGAREALQRVADGLSYIRKKFGDRLPEKVVLRLDAMRAQLIQVASLVDRMIPQALKDLNNKLKLIQRLLYQGDWHLVPGAGRIITRETEARLISNAVDAKDLWKLENARFPQNTPEVFVPKDGFPDLTEKYKSYDLPSGDKVKIYQVIPAFNGPMRAREIGEGKTLYRVLTERIDSLAEGAWWTETDPKTITGWYWRVKFAVLESWSRNGKYVRYTVPKGKTLRTWEGKVSSQIDNAATLRDGAKNPAFGQYLEGGETQIYIDFAFKENQWALDSVKELNKNKMDTNWLDIMNINIPPQSATVQKLGQYVEEQKSLNAANLATAANQASHIAQANREP